MLSTFDTTDWFYASVYADATTTVKQSSNIRTACEDAVQEYLRLQTAPYMKSGKCSMLQGVTAHHVQQQADHKHTNHAPKSLFCPDVYNAFAVLERLLTVAGSGLDYTGSAMSSDWHADT